MRLTLIDEVARLEVPLLHLTVGEVVVLGVSAGTLPFELPITNITDIAIPQSQHGRIKPSVVQTLRPDGQIMLASVRIDPADGAVLVHFGKPQTGKILIY